jgi:hypothetical protein
MEPLTSHHADICPARRQDRSNQADDHHHHVKWIRYLIRWADLTPPASPERVRCRRRAQSPCRMRISFTACPGSVPVSGPADQTDEPSRRLPLANQPIGPHHSTDKSRRPQRNGHEDDKQSGPTARAPPTTSGELVWGACARHSRDSCRRVRLRKVLKIDPTLWLF